jgi:thiol-disulfide isomerase/thioredoxin
MRRFTRQVVLLLALFGLFMPIPAAAQTAPSPVVRAVFFHSPTCGHCHHVIQEILMPMVEEYGERLEIVALDVSQPNGQALYQATIAHFDIPEERRGVPTIIMEDVVLVGSGEIPAQFPAMVEAALAADGTDWPMVPALQAALSQLPEAPASESQSAAEAEPADAAAPEAEASEGAVYLAYFFDPTCLECARVHDELAALQEQYPHLVVEEFNLQEETALNEAMATKFDVPAEERMLAPAIFIGNTYLAPGEIDADRLRTLIAAPEAAAATPPWAGLIATESQARQQILQRFQQFSIFAVAGAGLLDGVNPCAFTTIIFFVSYLALVGRRGRDILLVGGAFSLAVFLTYLTMGIGLAEVVHRIGSFTMIGRIIYGATALICLVLAGISLWDYVQIRRGKLTEIALQLPKGLKRRIHHTVRTSSRTQNYVLAAFGAGVLISIFELACTGQVYLPTIVFVTGVAEARPLAIAYLLVYNLMFVVPLVAVFVITYYGTSSQRLTSFFQAHAATVKLFTAALFGVLGVWLIYATQVI